MELPFTVNSKGNFHLLLTVNGNSKWNFHLPLRDCSSNQHITYRPNPRSFPKSTCLLADAVYMVLVKC